MFFSGDPFEHFAQHGGMGGGGGGGRRGGGRASAEVDTTKLYETLGVSCCLRVDKIYLITFVLRVF